MNNDSPEPLYLYKDALQAILADTKITERDLARAVQVNPGLIVQFVTGKRIPDKKLFVRIAAALDASNEQCEHLTNGIAASLLKRWAD